MKKNEIFFIGLICLAISGCYDVIVNHSLSLTNKSNVKISLLYSNHANKKQTENNVAYFIREDKVIDPDSSADITILGSENAWHDYIEEGKTKKMFLYIFNTDTLKRYNDVYSMDELINQGRYLKLLEYSEKDLDKIHWTITFKD